MLSLLTPIRPWVHQSPPVHIRARRIFSWVKIDERKSREGVLEKLKIRRNSMKIDLDKKAETWEC